MILARVIYELFECEVEFPEANRASSVVELDRQLRLEFKDGPAIFVSWTWGPVAEDYQIEFQKASFCSDVPAVERDVSASSMWAPLIGKVIELVYRDSAHRVVEVCTTDSRVFCCAFGNGLWGMDVLHLSTELPAGDYNRDTR